MEPMQDRHLSAAQPEVQRRLAGSLQFARLGHGQSVTYRVESESGRYLLRVHDPQHTALEPAANLPQSIESECLWLAALARDTDLNVAQPVAGAHGAVVFKKEITGKEQS
jgi:Ser/Thr protein kinase RdoA (MazF antagonist)